MSSFLLSGDLRKLAGTNVLDNEMNEVKQVNPIDRNTTQPCPQPSPIGYGFLTPNANSQNGGYSFRAPFSYKFYGDESRVTPTAETQQGGFPYRYYNADGKKSHCS